MTPEELNTIEARANAATKGPWNRTGEFPGCGLMTPGRFVVAYGDSDLKADCLLFRDEGPLSGPPFGIITPEDADFCASARSDVPALVAEVRRLREVLLAVRDRLGTSDIAAEWCHAALFPKTNT